MRPLALALLLAACSSETADPGATSTGDTSAQVGTGGQDGSGGDGGDGATTATTGSSTATTASTSTGDGEGGQGSTTAATTGAGGTGGAEPCPEPECVSNARVRCNDACPTAFDCEPLICEPAAPDDGTTVGLVGNEPNLIQLPPVPVQVPRCEGCAPDVLYALRLAMPGFDAGCIAVQVPPGVVWDVVIDPDGAPEACPDSREEECGLAAFDSNRTFLVLAVVEPSNQPRDVVVTVTPDENCVGVAEPDCDGVCG